ncbi:MAG: hypothetical protein ACRBCJ_04345 [Hyphomicrobiaceae bacterium]
MTSERQAVVIGTLFILASLYPYWLFGSASAIGWYDEYDAVIPYYLLRVASLSPLDFAHGYAGGTRVNAPLPDIGNGYVDFYLILIQWVGPELGSFLYRFLQMGLLYLGMFRMARQFFIASVPASAVAGLVGVFASVYPYAWVLGGYGWNWTLMVWAPLLFLSGIRPMSRMLFGFVYGAIAATTVTIGFFLPCLVLYCFVVTLFLRLPIYSIVLRNLSAILLIGVLLIWNNIPMLNLVMESWDQSSRFLRVTSPNALTSLFGGPPVPGPTLFESLQQVWKVFSLTLLRGLEVLNGHRTWQGFPFTVIFTAFAIAASIWLTLTRRSLLYILVLLVPTAGIAVLTFIGTAFRFPVISSYRWDILYLCLPFIYGFIFAMFIDDMDKTCKAGRYISRVSAFFLLGMTFVSVGGLSARAMDDLDAYGGWATLGHYSELAKFAEKAPLTRAGSMPAYKPKPYLGLNYGLDVIDGVRRDFTWRRVAFWFESLPLKSKSSWHTHRHTLGKKLDEINLDTLRITNTGLLLSTDSLESDAVTLVLALDGLRLKDMPSSYHQLLSKLLPRTQLVPPLYVYRLDNTWDRVFAPVELRLAEMNDFDLSYFGKLSTLPRHSLFIPQNAPNWLRKAALGGLKVRSVVKTRYGIRITTNGDEGQLVYNQEYTKSWQAHCGKTLLPLSPVNAMQMVVQIPQGCSLVMFRYKPEN